MAATGKKDTSAYLYLTSVVFLWGSSFAVSKIGLAEMTPLNLAGFRFIFASLVFGLILLMQKSGRSIGRADILPMAAMGFISITSYFFIQYTGLLYTTSINASLILATAPLWTTVFAVLTRQERVNAKAVAGILLAAVGVSLVISRGEFLRLFSSSTVVGDLLLLSNAFAVAVFNLYGKKILQKHSPFKAMAYIHIFGTLMLLPFVLISNPLNPVTLTAQLTGVSLPTVAAVSYLALLCSVYGYYMWYRGIAAIGAVRTAAFQYFNPLVAFFLGILLLQETVTSFVLLGGIMVIAGVYTTNKYKTPLPTSGQP
jgi:drug/metabolite transporter (DMT)-like permease